MRQPMRHGQSWQIVLMMLFGVADRHLGRYKTILYFSSFYCLGHGTIAAFDNLAVRCQPTAVLH